MNLRSLQSRPLLFKSFVHSWICIDEPFPQHPPNKFRNINSEDPTRQLTDVVLPVQSYISNVARGVEIMTRED